MQPIATDVWRGQRVSKTFMYPAKTAGPIEMPFGMCSGMGPSNHVSDGGSAYPQGKEAILGWGRGRPIAKYRKHEASAAEIEMAFNLWTRGAQETVN